MRKRLEFALRGRVTMSNLLESLAESFGKDERFPLDIRHGPGSSLAMSYGDAVLFTNLVAEALIRDLDLKKGERVLLINPSSKDLLLLSIGIIKAGGMVVPLDHRLGTDELKRRSEACMVNLSLIDSDVLAKHPGLMEPMPDPSRLMVSGAGSWALEDLNPLYAAVGEGSGFFIPYTLKPTSVVGLFYPDGSETSKAVMATNQVLLSAARLLALVLPLTRMSLVMSAAPLTTLSGFAAALLGLCGGSQVCLLNETDCVDVLESIQEGRPSMFMGTPQMYGEMLDAGASRYDLSSVRLWFSTGDTSPEHVRAFRRFGKLEMWRGRLPALFVASISTAETATVVGIRLWARGGGSGAEPVDVSVLPNRLKIVDGSGRRIRRGGVGELLVRGPSVTPGYWNDLQESYRSMRDGWLHTGVTSRR